MLLRLRALVVVIHHLNPWGGHERSTLEIVRRLTRKFPGTRILTYSLEDFPSQLKAWGAHSLLKVRPNLRRPAILLMLYFMLASFVRLIGGGPKLIQATGACSLLSDVIQVQFINASWRKKKKEFSKLKLFENPMARQTGILRNFFLGLYHQGLLLFNIGIEKITYRKSKTYIVLSELLKRELRQEFGIESQVHVIHHGVDPEFFRPPSVDSKDRIQIRNRHQVKDDEVLILFAGEYERKGLCVVLQTLAKLPSNLRARVKLLAVGGGSIEGFQSLADELGVRSQTVFLGHQKNVEAYYRAADLFLLPTYYEPFGLVILEAMSCGLPVIVTAEAGASELIEHGVSGLKIIDPSDIGEILGLLVPLCESSQKRQQMGAAARKVAEGRSWDHVASEYEAILRPLLELSQPEGSL
jgi:glycosyltransferase involved in cell wall biosynthesis